MAEVKSVTKDKKNGSKVLTALMGKKAAKAAAEKEQAGKGKNKKEKAAKKDALVKKGDVLPKLSEPEKKELAVKHDKRFRQLEKEVRVSGTEMMVILRDMKQYSLWNELKSEKTGNNFKSFDQWLREAAPQSRSAGYANLKAAEKLLPYIPKEELDSMPVRNRTLLSKISKIHFEKVATPIRQAAQGSEKGLREAIANHAPDEHIEEKRKLELDASAAPIICDALEACKHLNDFAGRDADADALEAICIDWLDSETNDQRFAGMSNRQAYEAWKQSQAAGKIAEAV